MKKMDNTIYFGVIWMLTAASIPLGQSLNGKCPDSLKPCDCGVDQAAIFITNCTNTNFTNAIVLRDIPATTELLVFTGNNLYELPVNLFGEPDHSSTKHEALKVIDMSNNNIHYVHGKSFHEVSNVRTLNLSENEIMITGKEYHSRLFSNFDNLEELYLDDAFGDVDRSENFVEDLISMIIEARPSKLRILSLKNNNLKAFPHPLAFCDLTSLQKLYLSGNNLTEIGLDLSCSQKLRYLDISYNQISTIDYQSLSQLQNVSRSFHIDLTGNPFNCDCTMRDFLDWFKSTPIFVVDRTSYVCSTGFPESNVNRSLVHLDFSELDCDYPKDSIHGYFSWTYVMLIILIFLSTFILIGLVYQNRNVLFTSCTKSWAQVITKSQYTSLEKDERRVNHEMDEVAV